MTTVAWPTTDPQVALWCWMAYAFAALWILARPRRS